MASTVRRLHLLESTDFRSIYLRDVKAFTFHKVLLKVKKWIYDNKIQRLITLFWKAPATYLSFCIRILIYDTMMKTSKKYASTNGTNKTTLVLENLEILSFEQPLKKYVQNNSNIYLNNVLIRFFFFAVCVCIHSKHWYRQIHTFLEMPNAVHS